MLSNIPRKQTQLMVSFSPAFGGNKKEDTTSIMVIRQGRMMEALDYLYFTRTLDIYCTYLYDGEYLCNRKVNVTSGYVSGTLAYLLVFLSA